jgi:hypothetical protein
MSEPTPEQPDTADTIPVPRAQLEATIRQVLHSHGSPVLYEYDCCVAELVAAFDVLLAAPPAEPEWEWAVSNDNSGGNGWWEYKLERNARSIVAKYSNHSLHRRWVRRGPWEPAP